MHRKLLKYIQDSDVAITILLFAIAGLSFRGVPDNIWNDYLYIDWVFHWLHPIFYLLLQLYF